MDDAGKGEGMRDRFSGAGIQGLVVRVSVQSPFVLLPLLGIRMMYAQIMSKRGSQQFSEAKLPYSPMVSLKHYLTIRLKLVISLLSQQIL